MAGQTSWNRPGPRGVTGPPGPQGPQGPAGTAGDKVLIRLLLLLLAIAAAILLLHTPAHAQDANFFEAGPFVYIGAASGIPATCNTGDLAFATDATAGQQIYEGNNSGGVCTFTQQLNSGGGGGSPGGSNTQIQYNNAGSFGGISKWTTNGITDFTGIATSVFDQSAGATHKLPLLSTPTTANLWGYDNTNNRALLGNGTDTSFLTWIHGTAPTTNDCVKFSGTLGALITNGGPCPSTKASVTHQFFTSYTSTTGAFTAAQPDYSDLTGTPTLAQTLVNASHKWLNSYSAITGLFTQTQPDYSDLSGTPALPVNTTATAHNFFTAYNSTTGAFTKAQPACGDLSDSAGGCSMSTTAGGDLSGTYPNPSVVNINGTAFSGTNGDLVKFGAANIPADTGFLATNVVRKDTTNTGAAAMTLDMSASTTANSLKVPVGAGLTSGADGAVAYDSTSKTTRIRTNTADSIAVATTSTSTTTTQVLHVTAVAGIYTPSAIVDADIPAAITRTIANGTSALGTGAISSATCATVVTTSATGTATTDNIMADFNADPHAVTGYVPSTSGMLTIIKYPTANNVNFLVCNNTSASITPGAITLNWRVVR